MAKFVRHDSLDLVVVHGLEKSICEKDVAEAAGDSHDGAVDHGAVGVPEEELGDADVVGIAKGEEACARWARWEGVCVPEVADHEWGECEDGEATCEGDGCDECRQGGNGGDEKISGVNPCHENEEWGEDDDELMAHLRDDVMAAGEDGRDVVALFKLPEEGGFAEDAVDGVVGVPGGDECGKRWDEDEEVGGEDVRGGEDAKGVEGAEQVDAEEVGDDDEKVGGVDDDVEDEKFAFGAGGVALDGSCDESA